VAVVKKEKQNDRRRNPKHETLTGFGACVVPGLIALELHSHQIFSGTLDQLCASPWASSFLVPRSSDMVC
jgi:hypothetical protein